MIAPYLASGCHHRPQSNLQADLFKAHLRPLLPLLRIPTLIAPFSEPRFQLQVNLLVDSQRSPITLIRRPWRRNHLRPPLHITRIMEQVHRRTNRHHLIPRRARRLLRSVRHHRKALG